MGLSSFYGGRSGQQPRGEHPHPITTPEAPPIGLGTEVLDEQGVTQAAAALDALVERAGTRVGVLRRLLTEAQEIERALLEKTERLRDCLERTCDASARLDSRIREADRLTQRLDGVDTTGLAQAAADLDRQAAQVQARIGVMVDEAEERVRHLQRQAEAVDDQGRRAERMELAADHLLGVLGKAREADLALSRTVAEARLEREASQPAQAPV